MNDISLILLAAHYIFNITYPQGCEAVYTFPEYINLGKYIRVISMNGIFYIAFSFVYIGKQGNTFNRVFSELSAMQK